MSSQNQITIPVDVLRDAGLRPGDDVVVRAAGGGRVAIERAESLVERYAGSLPPGTYPPGHIDAVRDEWRR